jgi:hypothetical protein
LGLQFFGVSQGRPQPGQAEAMSDISFPQSGQNILKTPMVVFFTAPADTHSGYPDMLPPWLVKT